MENRIITQLKNLKLRQNFASVYLKGNEKPMLVVIENYDDESVVIKPWNLHGNYLETTQFRINDITKILPLKPRYDDPFFSKLRSIKKTIRKIKEDMGRV